jgi:prepilin-type N-terminal cleavage/methylation domain-containing protein
MIIRLRKNRGFTLIEIAIVLIIVTILLGYTVAMVPVQQELKQYRKANAEMDRILDALYAFAQVNGRLPCPDDIFAPDGLENPSGGAPGCTRWYGYIPTKTLGLDGKLDNNFSLLDPWGSPYRYQVTSDDTAANGGDFVITDDIKNVGITNVSPDLSVCITNGPVNAAQTACPGGAVATVASNIPVVIISLGKDRGLVNSDIQRENTDNASFAGDRIFVKASRSDASGAEYDDIVKWISPNTLYSKMIDAGQL